jgi:hypothetical protein
MAHIIAEVTALCWTVTHVLCTAAITATADLVAAGITVFNAISFQQDTISTICQR